MAATADGSYRSSRLRTSTRSGGLRRSVLQAESLEDFGPVLETRSIVPEWLLLLRAGLGRERAAMVVAAMAVSVAALVIVVIPVITGQMG